MVSNHVFVALGGYPACRYLHATSTFQSETGDPSRVSGCFLTDRVSSFQVKVLIDMTIDGD